MFDSTLEISQENLFRLCAQHLYDLSGPSFDYNTNTVVVTDVFP